MLYWYSLVGNCWFVMVEGHEIIRYDSGVALRKDYPNAEYCKCEEA